MNLSCPVCSRETEVERDIGDFLTRCNRCGNFVRFPAASSGQTTPAATHASVRQAVRIRERIPATPVQTVVSTEVRQEADRIRARRAALSAAARKGKREAMGTLGWIGLGVVVVLAVIAISVKAQTVFSRSATASAGTMVMR
jgi:hypothetical protein